MEQPRGCLCGPLSVCIELTGKGSSGFGTAASGSRSSRRHDGGAPRERLRLGRRRASRANHSNQLFFILLFCYADSHCRRVLLLLSPLRANNNTRHHNPTTRIPNTPHVIAPRVDDVPVYATDSADRACRVSSPHCGINRNPTNLANRSPITLSLLRRGPCQRRPLTTTRVTQPRPGLRPRPSNSHSSILPTRRTPLLHPHHRLLRPRARPIRPPPCSATPPTLPSAVRRAQQAHHSNRGMDLYASGGADGRLRHRVGMLVRFEGRLRRGSGPRHQQGGALCPRRGTEISVAVWRESGAVPAAAVCDSGDAGASYLGGHYGLRGLGLENEDRASGC